MRSSLLLYKLVNLCGVDGLAFLDGFQNNDVLDLVAIYGQGVGVQNYQVSYLTCSDGALAVFFEDLVCTVDGDSLVDGDILIDVSQQHDGVAISNSSKSLSKGDVVNIANAITTFCTQLPRRNSVPKL